MILKEVLSNLSLEEQYFIRDRRLQLVHGIISHYENDRDIGYLVFEKGYVINKQITTQEYRDIQKKYYPKMSENLNIIMTKVIESKASHDLANFSNEFLGDSYIETTKIIAGELGQNVTINLNQDL